MELHNLKPAEGSVKNRKRSWKRGRVKKGGTSTEVTREQNLDLDIQGK